MKLVTLLFVMCALLSNKNCFAQAGTLDSTFGGDGTVKTRMGPKGTGGSSLAIQANGKIVVAGTYYSSRHTSDFVLTRYKTDGTLDSVFGVNGRIITDVGKQDYGNAVAIQADGKILVGGYSDYDFALLRYTQSGKLDSTFGKNGWVTTDFGDGDFGLSIAIQANGKIVLAGRTGFTPRGDLALARYNSNGNQDSSFGVNGRVVYGLPGVYEAASSLAIQDDGKIIAAGYTDDYQVDFLLIRFERNGKFDKSFGKNGKVTCDFGGDDAAYSVAIQQDGKIIAAGNTSTYPNADFALARYQQNGTIDNDFGVDGKVVTNIARLDYINSVAVQTNGKIVAAGGSFNGDRYNFSLARYQQNGTIDSAFGNYGTVITDFGNDDVCWSVGLQADGKIVAAGTTANSFAVARYNGDKTSLSKTSNNNFSNLQKQNSTTSTIRISPNPAKDILHISGLSSSLKTISIVDAKGKLLQQIATSNNNYSISTKQFSAGIYFLRIDEGDKTTALKFIKE